MGTASDHEMAVGQAFDSVAATYDAGFDAGERTRRLRNLIHSLIGSLATPSSHILDINCGTGTDAIALAAMGHSVVGLDISPLMIKEAKTKSSGMSQVHFLEGSYRALDSLGIKDFDLVLSNFGGLNCAPDMAELGVQAAHVLNPGGLFVAVVMPPVSLWDIGSKCARGQFFNAARRAWTGRATAEFDRTSFRVYYHSPSDLTKSLRPNFRRIDLVGLNIFSPPPHAGTFAASFPRLSHALAGLDDIVGSLPLLRSMGDHYVAVFQKRADR